MSPRGGSARRDAHRAVGAPAAGRLSGAVRSGDGGVRVDARSHPRHRWRSVLWTAGVVVLSADAGVAQQTVGHGRCAVGGAWPCARPVRHSVHARLQTARCVAQRGARQPSAGAGGRQRPREPDRRTLRHPHGRRARRPVHRRRAHQHEHFRVCGSARVRAGGAQARGVPASAGASATRRREPDESAVAAPSGLRSGHHQRVHLIHHAERAAGGVGGARPSADIVGHTHTGRLVVDRKRVPAYDCTAIGCVGLGCGMRPMGNAAERQFAAQVGMMGDAANVRALGSTFGTLATAAQVG
eukprot:ctg_173.g82